MLRFYHRTVADVRLLKQYPDSSECFNANARRCCRLASATHCRIEHPRWHLEWSEQTFDLAYEHQCPTSIHGPDNAQIYPM